MSPNVDVDKRLLFARRGIVSTNARLVDVGLNNCSPDHRRRGGSETERDLLDGGESDVSSSEERVDDLVEDGDEHDERERVD